MSKKQNRALSLARPWVFIPTLVFPIKFTYGHVARPWGFIAPRVLGKSCPASTRPYRTAVSLPLFGHGFRHARVSGRVCRIEGLVFCMHTSSA
ncbi:hypothetical protein GOBAR_AA17703 [Gossypium barbadense]|uniref:Uncharacterized protein n=1 Tax=Gossypium barbadense TaxID=3634 RepID=A0A2P5XHZ5_GOSBA|nr:hypothetical protein GOBAR_AA17703 [Gossypium barbadense]